MSKRKTTSDNQDLPSVKRTRSEGKHTKAKTELFNPDRNQKAREKSGLRHFSLLVLNKVESKKKTTYKQVADELINELDKGEEDKNIRRRVYDALNVLMAMDIITKDKKEIHWIGFPQNSSHEIIRLENEKKEINDRIQKKRVHLQELLLQEISFKNLLKRNSEQEKENDKSRKIPLPFILVNAHEETKINCEMLENRSHYRFEFDMPFEIHDDIEVLRRLGFNHCSRNDITSLLPPHLHSYLPPNVLANQDSETVLSYDPQSMTSSSSPVTSPSSFRYNVENFDNFEGMEHLDGFENEDGFAQYSENDSSSH